MFVIGGEIMDAAYLVIEKGGPYEKGFCIPLRGNKFIIGRSTKLFSPDISFDSFLISRKHCCIKHFNGEWTVADLGSKHDTIINNQPIAVFKEHILKSGDKIILASGVAAFRFMISLEFDKTLDFDRTQPAKIVNVPVVASPVVIDLNKMILMVDNQVVSLSVKEWLLLEILYRHRSKFVSYEEIKKTVWAERYCTDNSFPVAGMEEINMLIYRLRRKLGNHSKKVKTIRGRGYIFEL